MSANYNSSIVTDGLVLCLDAANPKSFSPNVFSKPTDIYGWVNTPTGNASTLSRDTIASPVGSTPLKMAVTGNDPHILTYNTAPWNIAPAVSGQTWRVSVYAKASTTVSGCEIYIFGANSSGTAANGLGGYYGIASKSFTVTTSWQRFDHYITFSDANVAYIQARVDGPNTGGAGTTVWWDGLQVEMSSAVTNFNSKTNANTASWYDAISSSVATFTGNPAYSQNVLTFDGSTQYATIPYDAKYNFNTAQTIGIWLKPTENDAVRRNPYNQAYAGGGTITHEPGGTFSYYCGTAGNNTNPYIGCSSTFTVAQNEIAYITVTRDSNLVSWYKNGVFDRATVNSYGTGVVTGTSNLLIGTGYAGNYMGNIYAVQLYTKALSATEVTQNFNALRGRYGI